MSHKLVIVREEGGIFTLTTMLGLFGLFNHLTIYPFKIIAKAIEFFEK